VPPRDAPFSASLITKLALHTDDLVRLRLARERTAAELAELGVVPRQARPAVGPRDSLRVARLKEELVRLDRRRQDALAALAALGATVLDEQTLELLLQGGPAPGSYLSWQPGEPTIAWWRASASLEDPRQPIADLADQVVHPTLH